jgi:hypothetical protein
MPSYEYDWTDFPGGSTLLADRLHTRVDDDGAIAEACAGVSIDEGAATVTFSFGSALDGGEETALDALVAGYSDETLAECKCACTDAVRAHFLKHVSDGASATNVADDITAVDNAIDAVDGAVDEAAAVAARDAYVEA